MSALAWIWTLGSAASIAALALVILEADWIRVIQREEVAIMHDLEGIQDTNLPLHVLAKKDDLVFVVVDRNIADGLHDWTGAVQLRLVKDKFDSRLRHLELRRAPTEPAPRRAQDGQRRRPPRRAPETKTQP